jgi:HAE1 family hydrophobic/amphiphilic exporter-1
MLMGVVMKNGILLVDYTNTVRARGVSVRDAVLEAGPVRLRPVLMTAVSTIFGMIPLAIGVGDGSEWRNPMSMVSIGGLMASTPHALPIVPIAYTLVHDAQRAWRAGSGPCSTRAQRFAAERLILAPHSEFSGRTRQPRATAR